MKSKNFIYNTNIIYIFSPIPSKISKNIRIFMKNEQISNCKNIEKMRLRRFNQEDV